MIVTIDGVRIPVVNVPYKSSANSFLDRWIEIGADEVTDIARMTAITRSMAVRCVLKHEMGHIQAWIRKQAPPDIYDREVDAWDRGMSLTIPYHVDETAYSCVREYALSTYRVARNERTSK